MMIKFLRIFSIGVLAVLLSVNTIYSQISIKGCVKDNENMPVPFANVVIYNLSDTTELKYGAITDLNGNYAFQEIKEDNYLLVISFMGYKNLKENLRLINGGSNTLMLNHVMETDFKVLGPAAVQESRTKIQSDKTTFIVLPSDIKGASSALELTTIIPQVIYDPANEKISSATGKAVKILINGMNANEIELKTLKPEHIARIEHYDIPPARYADFGGVLNIITRVREDGIAAGGNISSAFTTGFGNEMLYFKYNKGRSQIGADYSLYHRNYKKNQIESSYDYIFNDTRMQRFQRSNSAFGYDDSYVNLTFVNQKENDYALKIKLSPNFMTSHSNNVSQIDYLEAQESETRTGINTQRQSVLGPTADIYLWKQLKNKQELALNIVGTGFITSNDYSKKEFSDNGSLLLEDNMLEKNRKMSLIGEINYSVEFSKARFNAGYSIEANNLNSKVTNSFENIEYKTSFLKNYLYTELSGKSGKLSYKASLGLSNIRRETFTQQFDDWVFRPSALLGYSLGKGGVLSMQYRMYSSEPSIAQLSNNRVYVTEHIIRQGNPELRHSISNEIRLDWSWGTKFLDLKLSTIYLHTQRPINSYFSQGEEYIVIASENGIWSKSYVGVYSGTIKPFKSNIITARIQGQVLKSELSSTLAGNYSHIYAPMWYQINFQYKNWSAQYQGNIVGRALNGPYLRSNENQSNIIIGYIKGNLMISASCYWFLTKSKYSTVTIPESLVKYSSSNWIDDNKSMIVLGLRYNIFKGIKYNEKASKLQNADRDTGMF